ncbi:hypothetical protein PBRA_008116 [Plasmodiophora brassicae]|uniref:Histidine kinase n=1 Tax=Plasmodiophora brassicae TaxID=37360 RepID=A0A0G4J0E3_PLABS|nr:hypothetical protein PBRA_008116 [Plasmodiophora brassicae]
MPFWKRRHGRRRELPGASNATAKQATVDYRLLFEVIPARCLVLDPNLHVVTASDSYLEATMKCRDDITGRYVFDVYPQNPSDPSADGAHSMEASLDYVLQHRKTYAQAVQRYDVRNADGEFETKYWSSLIGPVLDPNTGDLVNIIIRVEDVTELVIARDRDPSAKREEETLRRMEWEVLQRAEQVQKQAHELEKMNGDLTEARDKAVDASNSKSTFVATISHELRTPLTGIVGFNDLLSATPLSDDQAHLVNMIGDSARVLHTLVNDLLDMTRLDAGKVVLEHTPFLVGKVVRKCERLLQGQAKLKSLSLHVDIEDDVPPMVRGDPNRLRQILTNLLNNAIKFTDSGSVTLTVSRIKGDDSEDRVIRVRFKIADSGIGIAHENLEGLFDPFFQVDSSDTRSVVGQGSVFWVDLPFDAVDPAGESIAADAPEVSADKSLNAEKAILVVDDNAIIRRLVSRQLSKLGYRNVLEACNGEEAVSTFEASGPVDLVLMDCQMPELDGCGATMALRNMESRSDRPHVPVVAMTASAMHRDRELCFSAGMNDMLTKPFTMADLASVLHRWL